MGQYLLISYDFRLFSFHSCIRDILDPDTRLLYV